MAYTKTKGGGINMDCSQPDRIKSSLARPDMNMKPSGTHAATPKGKNFMPKGMGGKK